jgi:predicted enzyme related to lactoylglutathione lyase
MGSAGMMALTPEMTEGGARPAWMGYVAVDDVDAKAAEFEKNGGSIHMPPTDIPGIGRFAFVADPQGAMIYVFKPIMPDGPLPDMPKPREQGTVGWHELYAGDGAEAFEFYAKMFGWTKDQAMDMGPMGIYQLFANGGEAIGGMMTKHPDTPSPRWNFVFSVDALDSAVDRVTSNGGTIAAGPMEVPGDEWAAQCLDPQGAAFGLVAPKR